MRHYDFKTIIKDRGDLEIIRGRLLDIFFFVFICIGFVPIAGSIIRVIYNGWKIQYIFHISIYVIFLLLFLTRKRFPARNIVIFLSTMMAINGTINMVNYGIASMGFYSFTFVIFMVTIFLGVRQGIISTIFLSIISFIFSYLVCNKYIPMDFDAQSYLVSWTGWASQLSFFITISIVVILFLHGITSSLFYSLDFLQKSKDEAILSEEKIRTLFETAPDAIVTTDMNGNITSCNEAALKLIGLKSKENLLGQSGFQFVIPDESERVQANLEILKKDKIIRTEYQIDCRDKGIVPIKVSASVFLDKEKNPLGIIYIVQDISQARELEEKLRQSEKMQAIGQLAGGVAHDFNNQLAGIVGYADLLREELSNNIELSHYADNIILASKRASDLTSQLLAFSRKGNYLKIPVDLHNVISEVVTMLNRTIDKRIKIKQVYEAQPPLTSGDPSQIQNAIMNIALNARDAMPEGGDLTFTTTLIDLDEKFCTSKTFEIKSGQYVQVSVTDNGEGMSEATKKRVFEPFFTTKPQGKGTGMGLASVYGTMMNHNGAINVYSELGHGTTINLYFPLYFQNENIISTHVNKTDVKGKGAHVLLVDDEDFVLKVASKMLEKSGYIVSIAINGKDALDIYRQNWQNIDLVILDMIMPEMNGKDTFFEMQKINPEISALLSSGYSKNNQTQEILNAGVKGFIQKPYRKSDLLHKVNEIIEKSILKE